MPMHDWTRVEAGTFHAFHLGWVAELKKALNTGLLPDAHYAMAEQFVGGDFPDTPARFEERRIATPLKGRSRSITVRHTSGHRIIAFVEIVSPANKDRAESVLDFASKVIAALQAGIHVLLIDPFPPGTADSLGMHGDVWRRLTSEKRKPPDERPLTLAAYSAGKPIQAFVNHLAVGDDIPEMPLFLTPKKYVEVPLETTYAAAYTGMPSFWRKILDKKPA